MNSSLKGRKSTTLTEVDVRSPEFMEKHGTLEVLIGQDNWSVKGRGRMVGNKASKVSLR